MGRIKRGARSSGATRLKLRRSVGDRGVGISLPRDWSDLGRWILAEAMQRALADATRPTGTATPRSTPFPRLVTECSGAAWRSRA